MELSEAVDLAKKKFHRLILPQELVVRSPSKSEEVWKGLMDVSRIEQSHISVTTSVFMALIYYLQNDAEERDK